MFVQERAARILAELDRRPRQSSTQLLRRLGVSRSTLRRDLMELEAAGELVRVHGGVVRTGKTVGEPSFDKKTAAHAAAKRAIGSAAAAAVPDGAQVFVDGGSTCLQAARQLMAREDLTLWTNSVRLLVEAEAARATICSVGGQVRGRSLSLMGGLASRWLATLRVDVALIGASGLDDAGPSTTDLHDAGVKHAALAAADTKLLLADASKCDRPAAVRFADFTDFTAWIVDATGRGLPRLPRDAGCGVQRVRVEGV